MEKMFKRNYSGRKGCKTGQDSVGLGECIKQMLLIKGRKVTGEKNNIFKGMQGRK